MFICLKWEVFCIRFFIYCLFEDNNDVKYEIIEEINNFMLKLFLHVLTKYTSKIKITHGI